MPGWYSGRMTKRILVRIGTVALAFALGGCIFFESKRDRAMRNDPTFQAGYSDGCASANNRGTNFRGSQVRDDALFQTSPPYRAGWGEGYGSQTAPTHHVVAIDYGIKRNILRLLADHGCKVTVLPATATA